MAEKPKANKKLVVKKSKKGGTIADKIEKQREKSRKPPQQEQQKAEQSHVEQAPQQAQQAKQQKAVEPSQQQAATSREEGRAEAKPRSSQRTVFIEAGEGGMPGQQQQQQPGRSGGKKQKKKSNLREDILKQEEHKKFFLKQQNKGKGKKKSESRSEQQSQPQQSTTSSIPKEIKITEYIQVGELARKLNVKTPAIISKLMNMGVMATITQSIDADTASLVAAEYGTEVKVVSLYDETVITEEEDTEEQLQARPPVVTVMGHVDHGKTKLLDALRTTDTASGEVGGITQHIGAYQISRPKGYVTFLDTPGHAAFTAMRARGAQVTDIVVLVVAADDGVMPQTLEAVQHAKDAQVPIIVAVNKIDKEEANSERIRQELSQYDLVPEEWGGETPFVEVSALNHLNLDQLEDVILAQAEVMVIRANPNRRATGSVIEAKLDQGRGSVATILIINGTLRQGDPYVVGVEGGRVRAMVNDRGYTVKEATPGMPVEILGLTGVPNAGDPFHVLESEREAKEIVEKRQELQRQQQAQKIKKVKLENLNEIIEEGKVKELKLVIKGDVRGSVEALQSAFEDLSNEEVKVSVILGGTGEITESDVMLASAGNAMIVGFNTRANAKVREVANKEGVEIRYYNIIYQAIDDMKEAMSGLLSPEVREESIGELEVQDIFKISALGTVAGCQVRSGRVKRQSQVRLIRDGSVIYDGKLKSLKRFQNDTNEVKEGYECGVLLDNYNDVKVGDIIEAYEKVEEKRRLEDVGKQTSNEEKPASDS